MHGTCVFCEKSGKILIYFSYPLTKLTKDTKGNWEVCKPNLILVGLVSFVREKGRLPTTFGLRFLGHHSVLVIYMHQD